MNPPIATFPCLRPSRFARRPWGTAHATLVALFVAPFLASPGNADTPSAPTMNPPVEGMRQVVLTWTPIPKASSYNVYVGTKAGAEDSTPIKRVTAGASTVISGLDNDVPYYFVVDAVVGATNTSKSNETVARPTSTAVPANVSATAGDSRVTIRWTSVGATSYEIHQGESPGKESSTAVLTGISGDSPTIETTITGLPNGKTYFFKVKAVVLGGTSTESAETYATPGPLIVSGPGGPKADLVIPDAKTNCAGFLSTNIAASSQSIPSAEEVTSIVRQVRSSLAKYRPGSMPTSPPLVDAYKCNGWLADFLVQQQTTSAKESIQAFPKFNASLADNSQLVTTHFVSAFIPMWLYNRDQIEHPKNADETPTDASELAPRVNAHFWNDLGFDVSSSVPISAATVADYAKQELLIRDGGLLNIYVSLSGRDYSNEAYRWGNRKSNLDRSYWVDVIDGRQPATSNEALGFISHGIGIKALKTQLTGTGNLGAQANAYVGWGFDGPLFKAAQEGTNAANTANTADGVVSFEMYASMNWVTHGALVNLVGTTLRQNTFYSYGANLTFFITDTIGIQLQFASAQNTGVGHSVGHVAMLSFGYNKPAAAPSN